MKMDFLTRFKGKTSTVNKREGVNGVISMSSTPIEKLNGQYTFSSYLQAAANQCLDYNYRPSQSNDVTPVNQVKSQVFTHIQPPRKLSLASPLKPLDQPIKSQTQMIRGMQQEQLHIPLSKTGDLSDYQLVAIPKRLLQYGIKVESEGDLPSNKKVNLFKSQSIEPKILLSIGSYARQNERKRSLLLAGYNAMNT